MKQIALAALMLAASFQAAAGAGYDALNAGIQYVNDGAWDNAIFWFDQAIAAGDLVPDQTRIAYYDRGMAHAARGEYPDAISDYTAALALKPGDGAVSRDRALAYLATGNFENAFPDLNTAHLKYPDSVMIDVQTGLAAWRLGQYEAARTVFARLTGREPTAWLWLQLANAKLGMPPASIEDEKFDPNQWPNPLRALYAGKIDGDTALKAQQDSPAAEAQACDANFYVGEWRLVHGDIAAARPLMEKAAELCDRNTNEKDMALFEGKKLMER